MAWVLRPTTAYCRISVVIKPNFWRTRREDWWVESGEYGEDGSDLHLICLLIDSRIHDFGVIKVEIEVESSFRSVVVVGVLHSASKRFKSATS
jgi:hypothetical protein